MSTEVEAVFVGGVLRPETPVALVEGQRVRLTIHEEPDSSTRGYGLLRWTGRMEDLDALISDPENDPLERS